VRLRNISLIFILFAGLPTVALAQASSSASSKDSASGVSAQSINLPKDIPVLAKLRTDLDTAGAEPNDSVEAELVEDLRSDHEVWLPKGTVLGGRVVGAQVFSSEDLKSVVSIVFDRVILRDGEQRAGNFRIQAIAPAEGSRIDAEVNPNIHVREIKAVVGPLDHKSVGAYNMRGVELQYVVTRKGDASLVTSTSGNVRLRKGMQIVFITTDQVVHNQGS
jgi:hypothetical protein